jgi:hypothetical protein
MLRMSLRPLLLAMIFLVSGCGLPQRTYQVQVINATDQPLSAGLIKSGPPLEDGWQAPADIALHAPPLADRQWGRLIEPQSTVVIGPQTGRFADQVHAVLRVYAGNPTIEELLAYRRDDPDRVDVYLWPGPSSYRIERRQGRLVAVRQEPAPASAGP